MKKTSKLKRLAPVRVQPVVRQMWAVRWLYFGGQSNPHPAGKHGAWMLCCNKILAESKRVNDKQVITRVRVAILPNR